ncbi:unnamed protein product [Closterium sp. Naga37s-1]|nr:unnamed protein product [Closterium sp. Naga37s-1]
MVLLLLLFISLAPPPPPLLLIPQLYSSRTYRKAPILPMSSLHIPFPFLLHLSHSLFALSPLPIPQLYSSCAYRKALISPMSTLPIPFPPIFPSLTAYALLLLADIRPGHIVLDPMCGCGTLPLEAADWLKSRISAFGGDKDAGAVDAAATNGIALRTAAANSIALRTATANSSTLGMAIANGDAARRSQGGHVAGCDWLVWDASALPLRTGCVDRVLCDMPFGVRCGNFKMRERLCPAVIRQVCVREVGREWGKEGGKEGEKEGVCVREGMGRSGEGGGEEGKEVARVLTPGTGVAVLMAVGRGVRAAVEGLSVCLQEKQLLHPHRLSPPFHVPLSFVLLLRAGVAVLMAVGRGVRAAVEGLAVCLREKQLLHPHPLSTPFVSLLPAGVAVLMAVGRGVRAAVEGPAGLAVCLSAALAAGPPTTSSHPCLSSSVSPHSPLSSPTAGVAVLMAMGRGVRAAVEGLAVCLTGSADGGGQGRLAVLMAVGRGVRAAVEGLAVCLREKQRLAVEMEVRGEGEQVSCLKGSLHSAEKAQLKDGV